MSGDLLITGIGELVTCDPARDDPPGVVRDAALLIRAGVIVHAGPESALPRDRAADVEEIDARGAAVVPGFVDSHTHIIWLGERSEEYAMRAAGRSYEEIAAAGGGIRSTVRATAAGDVDALRDAAATRARRMLALGTTTVEVKSGYGLAHEAEMRSLDAALRLRDDPQLPDMVTTWLPLHAAPEGDRGAFIDDVCSRGATDAATRARFADAFCETGAYSVEECARLAAAAAAQGMRLKLHAEQRTRSGGAQLAARCGAVSADHLEHASDDDLRALAAAGTVATILPGAALVLGGPPPPGRRALLAGCTLAIATDCNPGTCYAESMPLMLSLAVATAGITPAQAVAAATAGGAAALGLHDRGLLRPGMRGDCVILSTPHWLDVAYHLGGDVIAGVIRAGRAAA